MAHLCCYICRVNQKLSTLIMKSDKSIIISPRVINTINALPESDRGPVATALAEEWILRSRRQGVLTPLQEMVYLMIRSYIIRDNKVSALA